MTPLPLHVSLDIETLGTSNEATIVSIGATFFDTEGVKSNPFYMGIELTHPDSKRAVDLDTVLWWLQQDSDIRHREFFAEPRMPLPRTLVFLNSWLTAAPNALIWTKGNFDIPILEHAYARCGMVPLWNFRQIRDFRTLKHIGILMNMTFENASGRHSALHDAINQANDAARILKLIEETGNQKKNEKLPH